MQLLSELLHSQRVLVRFGEGAAGGSKAFADFHGDMGDEHAMFLPKLVDLLLARVEEVIEVVYEKHAFPR